MPIIKEYFTVSAFFILQENSSLAVGEEAVPTIHIFFRVEVEYKFPVPNDNRNYLFYLLYDGCFKIVETN